MEQVHVSTQHEVNKLWQQLINILEQAHTQGQYHVLYANLKVAVALLQNTHFQDQLTLCAKDLDSIHHYLLTLGRAADEATFHKFLHEDVVSCFYKIPIAFDPTVLQKLKNEFEQQLPFESHTKLDFTPFHKQLNEIFEDNEVLRTLKSEFKKQHKKRINQLKFGPIINRYQVFMTTLVPYIKELIDKDSPSVNATYIEQVLFLLEDGWYIKHAQLPGGELLWHSLLPLQNTLDTDRVTNLFPAFAALPFNSSELSAFKYAKCVLAIQAIAQQISVLNKSAVDNIEVVSNLINIVFALNERLAQLHLTKIQCALLNDQQSRLRKMREVFATNKESLAAQKEFSANTLEFIKDLFKTCVDILGEPPIDMALCALGSSSRIDRRPYSDVELLLLYHQPEHKKLFKDAFQAHRETQRITLYLYHLLGLIELMIVGLGESHIQSVKTKEIKYGFHLDSTCHILDKELFGTMHHIITTYITEVIQSRDTTTPMQNHPWYNGESFFALLQPKLINTDNLYGSHKIIKAYDTAVQSFLEAIPTPDDEVAVLQTFLKLKANVNLFNLKRRELIALSTLQHVLEKSAHYFNCKNGETVEVKVAFYKPLTYLALSLKLFYNVTAEHPIDIFDTVSQQLGWGQTAVLSLFKAALAFIAQLQNKLHQKAQQQEEHIIWLGSAAANIPPYQILAPIEYAILDLLQHSLIKPLASLLTSYYEKPATELKNILHLLLKSHLNYRNSDWVQKWTQHPTHAVTPDALFAHPFIKILADYPSRDGWSPTYEQTKYRWSAELLTLTTTDETACLIEGIPTAQQKVSYLPQAIVAQLFDSKGEFKGNVHYSARSKVRQVSWPADPTNPKTFYFKVKPGNEAGLMGREFAVINLHQLLGGQSHIALGWPLKLTYLTAKGSKIYYCWVSEEVPGSSLSEVMDNAQRFELINTMLDKPSYSHLFITHYLTSPEDGQPDNFKIEPIHDGTFKLYELDVGQSFVGTVYEKRKVLAVKTMLYLLEPAIHQALDKQVLTRLMLLEPQALIKNWKFNLDRIKKIFDPLLGTNTPGHSFIDSIENIYRCVQTRFTLLSNWLYTYPQQIPSGLRLLKALDPVVAYRYLSLQGKIKTPKDFKDNLDPDAYRENPSTGKMYSSTTYLQIQQQTLTPERLQASLDLGEEYFAGVDFQRLQDNEEQSFVLRMLQVAINRKNSFSYLNLSGCRVITEIELLALLQKLPDLKELHLQNCPQFNLSTVLKILSFKLNERITGFFRWDYDVLCPQLSKLSLTLAGKIHILNFPITLIGRKQCLVNTMQWQQQFMNYLNKLLTMLKASKFNNRYAAIKSLGYFAQQLPETKFLIILEQLIIRASSEDSWALQLSAQAEAVTSLSKFVIARIPELQIPLILELLLANENDKSIFVKVAAIDSLWKFSTGLSEAQIPTVVKFIIAQLRHTTKSLHAPALDFLNKIAERLSKAQMLAVIEQLVIRLGNNGKDTQINATRLLAYFAGRLLETRGLRVLNLLLLSIEDIKKEKRIDAKMTLNYFVEILVDKQVPIVFERLFPKIENTNHQKVRKVAIQSLSKLAMRLPEAKILDFVTQLLTILQENDYSVVRAALEELNNLIMRLPDMQVFIVLEKLLTKLQDENHWKVQKLVTEGLDILIMRLSEMQVYLVFERLLLTLGDREHCPMQEATIRNLVKLAAHFPKAKISDIFSLLLTKLEGKDYLVIEAAIEILNVLVSHLSVQQVSIISKKLLLRLEENSFWEMHKAVIEKLVKLAAQLSEAKISDIVALLLTKLEENDYWAMEAVIKGLNVLVTRLPDVQVPIVFEKLLARVGKDEYSVSVKVVAMEGLISLTPKQKPEAISTAIAILLSKLKVKHWYHEQIVAMKGLVSLVTFLTNAQISNFFDKLFSKLGDYDKHVRTSILKSLDELALSLPESQIQTIIPLLFANLENKDLINVSNIEFIDENKLIKQISKFLVRLPEEKISAVLELVLCELEKKYYGFKEVRVKCISCLAARLSEPQILMFFEHLFAKIKDEEFVYVQVAKIFAEILLQISKTLISLDFDKLISKVTDSNKYVRTAVIKGLCAILPKLSETQILVVLNSFFLRLKEEKSLIMAIMSGLDGITEQLLETQILVVIELLITKLSDKDLYVKEVAGKNLPPLLKRLPEEQISEVIKLLLIRVEDKDWYVQQVALWSLSILVTRLPQAYITDIIKLLITKLEDKNSNVRSTAVVCIGTLLEKIPKAQLLDIIELLLTRLEDNTDVKAVTAESLGQFFSIPNTLEWLHWCITQADKKDIVDFPNDNILVNQAVLFEIFSFLNRKTLLQVVPQVNKDWRRWQKVYLQHQAERSRTQFFQPPDNNNEVETNGENSFNRFLPQ